jgi:hypothetical protein
LTFEEYLFIIAEMREQTAVINMHYANVQPSPTEGRKEIAILSRERKSPVKPSEKVLIANNITDNLIFLGEGIVDFVMEPRLLKDEDLDNWPNKEFAKRYIHDLKKTQENKDKPIHLHKFNISNFRAFQGSNFTLDRLSFSLLAVDKFAKPIVHFQHQIRNLTWEDYETIRQGWVYLARTAFAKIANALPLRNRIELRLWIDKEFGYERENEVDYIKYFDLLYEYLEARIFSRGRLLIATDEMINEVLQDMSSQDRVQIGLSTELGIPDSIREQADRFRKLFEKGKPELLKELNDEVIRNRDSQERFQQLFRYEPLPLILNQA